MKMNISDPLILPAKYVNVKYFEHEVCLSIHLAARTDCYLIEAARHLLRTLTRKVYLKLSF